MSIIILTVKYSMLLFYYMKNDLLRFDEGIEYNAVCLAI